MQNSLRQNEKKENPENIKQIDKQSFRKRKAYNPQCRKEIDRHSFRKRKAENPEHIRQINRNAKLRKKVTIIMIKDVPALAAEMQFLTLENESITTIIDDGLAEQKSKNIYFSIVNSFHNSIKRGPEYICTCCDQLWYRSSFVKCDANKYKACSQDVIASCVTGVKSVDNTEWIWSTCDSNLKKSKLPSCSKANKMSFPKKPELLNLTPLEERLISPRIPFMQLPRGGQLSIHGNVVNVQSDVNSTVNSLPRPINESQIIPINRT